MADNSQKAEDVGELSVEKAIARKKKQQQPPPPPRSSPRRKKTGPTVTQRILQVAAATKERRGISLAALKKALSAKGYDVSRNNTRVNQTVKQLVRNGSLVQTAGVGAAGSFRFNRSRTRPDTPALGGALGGGGVAAAAAAAAATVTLPAAAAGTAPLKDETGGGAPKKKVSAPTKVTPAASRKGSQTKSSAAAKKSRAAGAGAAARRKGATAKPRKAAPTRRKLKPARRPGAARGKAGRPRPYRRNKPLRGGRKTAAGANIHRRRPSAGSKPKRSVGRPRKYPPFGPKRVNYARR
ncbi:histone H1-like [Carcharodon carcharias]|uniref:histone H1-like n=1 Tax=Carcharodon carcharias TaxID=13397 RepID=UPI001B7DD11B|nr:histone H1-like [Carcharodon carcharias]